MCEIKKEKSMKSFWEPNTIKKEKEKIGLALGPERIKLVLKRIDWVQYFFLKIGTESKITINFYYIKIVSGAMIK